jgi:hypothetical protein
VGYRTCTNIDHCALETAYFKNGKALFQLHGCLKKAGVVVPSNSVPLDHEGGSDDEEVIVEAVAGGDVEVLECEGKPEAGN